MMPYRTLKASAGRHAFLPGQAIDLPDDEASALIQAGAIEPLSAPPVKSAGESEPPKRGRPRKDD